MDPICPRTCVRVQCHVIRAHTLEKTEWTLDFWLASRNVPHTCSITFNRATLPDHALSNDATIYANHHSKARDNRMGLLHDGECLDDDSFLDTPLLGRMNQGRSGLCGKLRTNGWRRLGGVLCPSGLLCNERNGCLRSRLGDRWVARLPVIRVPCRANHIHGLLAVSYTHLTLPTKA